MPETREEGNTRFRGRHGGFLHGLTGSGGLQPPFAITGEGACTKTDGVACGVTKNGGLRPPLPVGLYAVQKSAVRGRHVLGICLAIRPAATTTIT